MPQITEAQLIDPTYTGPRPSPTIPSGGVFTVGCAETINAPPAAVYEALINISRYNEWNSFVIKVDVSKPAPDKEDQTRMAEGMLMNFNVIMDKGGKTTGSPEYVVQAGPLETYETLEQAAREDAEREGKPAPESKDRSGASPPTTTVRWVAKMMPTFLLCAEHVNRIEDLGDGTTRYVHWETFGGPIAYAIKFTAGEKIRGHFINWAKELKEFVEKGAH